MQNIEASKTIKLEIFKVAPFHLLLRSERALVCSVQCLGLTTGDPESCSHSCGHDTLFPVRAQNTFVNNYRPHSNNKPLHNILLSLLRSLIQVMMDCGEIKSFICHLAQRGVDIKLSVLVF